MPPGLPSPIKGVSVTRGDGSSAVVVTVKDAAALMGLPPSQIKRWIAGGKLAICLDPRGVQRVFVDSLWALVPEEFRR